ncbi:MAG: dTDP-glucose 4,6-dehydratase [Candidatus Moranbacteria bacterium]|nr:dTDP-glucose 4,6-dehydratase [Candidatus Moranbacteria bacterium]
MKILVTGGAGFMGSNFIKYIFNKYPDYQVVNLDKLTYAGNLENLKEIKENPNYKFVKGDIARNKDLNKALDKGVDVIINYAAETHVDRSILNPRAFVETDVLGIYELLEAVKQGKAQKMIQISTDEVFGEIDEGEFFENSPFEPNSPYSASKAGGDLLCRAYNVTYNTPVIITHSCNFYGPYQYPEKLIPLFITNLMENKKVPLYNQGKNIREWIYTEDHCRAIDQILHQGRIGEVYNIGSGERLKNIEIANLILEALGKTRDMIEHVKDRPGHDSRYAVNSDKLRKNLDWEPRVKFQEGIKKTVQWYKDNPEWWQKLKNNEYWQYYKKQYQTNDENSPKDSPI